MAQILIIDDNDLIRDMLRQTLEREGYEVIEARNGNEGIECFHATPIDLVITDILMPEKEGLETIMELRQISPNIKIIVVSGDDSPACAFNTAKRLGARQAIQKPFGVREIIDLVRHTLEGD